MKLCFVIMPIGSGDLYEQHLNRYTNIIKPAIEGHVQGGERVFDALRADFITKTGSINKSVIQHIYNADLVIADLTTLNPNVFYELGVRHSLRNGTILVALEGTELPFDVGDLRVVFYRDRVGAEKKAIPEIQRLIKTLAEAHAPEDSPVFGVLPELQEPQTRDLLEARARGSALEAEAHELRVKIGLAEESNLRLRDSFTTFERTINTVLDRLRPQDRAAAEEAVERAVKARIDEPRRTPRVLHGVEENPSIVFVLMPFGEELEPIYGPIREAAKRVGLHAMRADEMVAPGQIIAQVSEAIGRAGLIVADITGQNANVLFEIGMASSLDKRILIISQDMERIPFDLAHQRVIFYENTIRGGAQLREQLVLAMKQVAGGDAVESGTSLSAVSDGEVARAVNITEVYEAIHSLELKLGITPTRFSTLLDGDILNAEHLNELMEPIARIRNAFGLVVQWNNLPVSAGQPMTAAIMNEVYANMREAIKKSRMNTKGAG